MLTLPLTPAKFFSICAGTQSAAKFIANSLSQIRLFWRNHSNIVNAHSPFRLIDEELQYTSYESMLRVGVYIGELELLI